MTHLTMEVLLGWRDRASEPGNAAAREHVQECGHCQEELERLHQRVAQLKALPTLRPARDSWPMVAAKVRADRWRRRSYQAAGLVGLAMAASLAITVVTRKPEAPAGGTAETVARVESIHDAQKRSQAYEDALKSYEPDSQVLDGHTATVAQALEDRLAEVDRAISLAGLDQEHPPEQQVVDLWRERAGLLQALVNVHATRTSQVEF